MIDRRAEDARVIAESGRVIAENERVVNEKDEEVGRVTAEGHRVEAEDERDEAEGNGTNGGGRVEAEKGRVTAESARVTAEEGRVTDAARGKAAQEAFEDQLEALKEDPDHYMTPGARRYFRRVALGYIILAIGTTFAIQALTARTDDAIREDINKVSEAQCLGSIPTLNNYNDLVQIQIESNRASRALAEKENDEARVAITTKNIIRLQENKLRVPNAKECSAPILK